MIYLAILFITFLFIYTLFSFFISTNQKKVDSLAKVLTISAIVGFILIFAAYIIYYVNIRLLDSPELSAAASDAFYVFATPATVFALITVILTVAIHFISGKLQGVRIAVSHLASLLILLYTLICASWSHYDEIDLAVYVIILGIALSLSCLASPALQMKSFSLKLLDKDFVNARLSKQGKKKTYAMERRRIRETKKRIKKGTKR